MTMGRLHLSAACARPSVERPGRLFSGPIAVLWLLLASGPATGALLVADGAGGCGFAQDKEQLTASLVGQVLASAETAGAVNVDDSSPVPSPDEPSREPAFHLANGFLPASGWHSTSASQSGGHSGSQTALAASPACLPEAGPRGVLHTEAKAILPSGPPFKLLRPV